MRDPNFSLIKLPDQFRARRFTMRQQLLTNGELCIFDAKGPGCLRHFWLTSNGSGRGVTIRIRVDDASVPQVDMPLNAFFAVLLGLEPYVVDSPAIQVLPNNAYNCYFPIPFDKSCKVTLVGADVGDRFEPWDQPWNFTDKPAEDVDIFAQFDWQQYDSAEQLPAYRFHADFSSEHPAKHKDVFTMGDIQGKGFIAGITKAIRHLDKEDLIYHTGGSTWLIDGETDPHVVRGFNEEDDFGFSWGYFPYQSRWVGCPHIVGKGPLASEFVAWRMFVPDPIPFKSSLKVYFGSRPDDTEGVLYYYKIPDTTAPSVVTPLKWQIVAPFDAVTFDKFDTDDDITDILAAEDKFSITLDSSHAWCDPRTEFRKRFDMWQQYPTQICQNDKTLIGGDRWPVGVACYAIGKIDVDHAGEYNLRLAFDDWCKVWINNKLSVTLRHEDGFEIANVPVMLNQGQNTITIKLSNQDNREFRLFAFNCVIEQR